MAGRGEFVGRGIFDVVKEEGEGAVGGSEVHGVGRQIVVRDAIDVKDGAIVVDDHDQVDVGAVT